MHEQRSAVTIALAQLLTCFLLSNCASAPAKSPLTVAGTSLPGYVRGSSNSNAEEVIVFVHGIFGNGRDTWTNRSTGAYFPRLLTEDRLFDKADVWVYDYPTSPTLRSYSIDELADHLRRHLRDDNVIANHKRIIFIAHSMGGLIVRAYLLKYREQVPPDQISLLYFFSTPSTGTDLANFGRFLSKNPQLADMRKMTTGGSGVLAAWDAQWNSSPYARRVASFCAYETLQTHGMQVVQRESAEHLCNRRLDPILADHIDIVKPAGLKSESYIAFRDAYREVLGQPTSLMRPPVLNLRTQSRGFVEASNSSADPACSSCWSSEVPIELTQRVFVRLHYENDGESTAHHVRLRLATPTDLLADPLVSATLLSDDTDPVRGAVCIGSEAGPIVFIPETAAWYPNNSKNPLPLPYNQAPAALSSPQGLDVGDLSPGLEFSSDIVVTFKTLPITVACLRDVKDFMARLEPTILARGGEINFAELARDVREEDFHLGAAAIDLDDSFRARGFVSGLDNLRADEMVIAYVFVHNENSVPLHAAKLRLFAEDDPRRLHVVVEAQETTFEVARISVSFAGGARSIDGVSAFRFPPGFCQTTHSVAEIMKFALDSDDNDRFQLGDLAPEETALVGFYFEVH
jgi:pimeloyl-ACP methyl ester carboxylesterase